MKSGPLVVLLLIVVGVQALILGGQHWRPWQQQAAPTKSSAVKAVMIERVQGSDLKRLTLTAKAAERLDIQTAKVSDQLIVRKRIVPGEVSALPVAPVVTVGVASTGAAVPSGTLVRVPITSDMSTVARDQPVMVLTTSHNAGMAGLQAKAIALPIGVRSDEATKSLYYAVDGSGQTLVAGQRVRVAFALAGSETPRKVIPYAAVLYDATGVAWVYTNPEPLVFVRHRISVDFVEADQVVLLDGPPNGASVVTVGAIELWGSEFFVGH